MTSHSAENDLNELFVSFVQPSPSLALDTDEEDMQEQKTLSCHIDSMGLW